MIGRKPSQSERRNRFLTNLLHLAGALALGLAGCSAPYPNALLDANGNEIRLEGIQAVLDDEDLSEQEKRQALAGLGIADEDLIDALLSGGL